MSSGPNKAEDTGGKNHFCFENHEHDSGAILQPEGGHSQPGLNAIDADEKLSTSRNNQHDASFPAPGSAELTPTEYDVSISFPDGGFQAWLVVFGSFCAQGAVFGLINTAAVFESYFKENQLKDYNNSQIGWIFSLYLFLVFFVGVQVGPIFDKHGPRLLLAGGSFCVVTSLMLLSVSQSKSSAC